MPMSHFRLPWNVLTPVRWEDPCPVSGTDVFHWLNGERAARAEPVLDVCFRLLFESVVFCRNWVSQRTGNCLALHVLSQTSIGARRAFWCVCQSPRFLVRECIMRAMQTSFTRKRQAHGHTSLIHASLICTEDQRSWSSNPVLVWSLKANSTTWVIAEPVICACGRNWFSPYKNGSRSITQLLSRPKVSESHCVISQEPYSVRNPSSPSRVTGKVGHLPLKTWFVRLSTLKPSFSLTQ